MRKITKVFVTILGSINIVFNIFLPIAIGLIVINLFKLRPFSSIVILVISMVSTFYRAIEVGFLKHRRKR